MTSRRRARGQVMPIAAMMLMLFLLLSALVLETAMRFAVQRDLEVIAKAAAEAGAMQVDLVSGCADAASCAVTVDHDHAVAAAAAVGGQWIAQWAGSRLVSPGTAPATGSVAASADAASVTVVVARCYTTPVFSMLDIASPECPQGGSLQRVAFTARPVVGRPVLGAP